MNQDQQRKRDRLRAIRRIALRRRRAAEAQDAEDMAADDGLDLVDPAPPQDPLPEEP